MHKPMKTLPVIEAVYVHIPFCRKKCNYCDFVSFPGEGLPDKVYCRALVAEGELYQKFLSNSQKELKSIYIGGGTPTCLPAEDLVQVITKLLKFFPVEKNGEITVECNPRTVDLAYLSTLRKAGVNRLSIGAQSFDPGLLKEMGRVHGAEDITETVYQARAAGFGNINLDLIYGLPGQTMTQWAKTLALAVSLPVTHLSVYGLKLSEESVWGKQYSAGTLSLPDADMSADMQEWAMDYLPGQGYLQYEIANFARSEFFSVHNRVYWNNGNYLGLGLSASSHFDRIRQTNVASLTSYLREVSGGRFPIGQKEILDRETEMGETIFLGLRLRKGISFNAFKQRFGVDLRQKYGAEVEKLVRLGLVECDQDRMRLTKKGVFLGNEVFMEFLP